MPAKSQDSGGVLSRTALVAQVAEQTGLTVSRANELVGTVLDTIQVSLQAGRDVRLTGFGTFTVSRRKASIGRDPRTGTPIDIGPSYSVKFRPGRLLKDAVGTEGG